MQKYGSVLNPQLTILLKAGIRVMSENSDYKKIERMNNKRQRDLSGEYATFYNRLKKDLYKDVQKSEALNNVLSDMIDMLLEAINEKRPITDVITVKYEEFYDDLVQSLPQYTKETKYRIQKRKKYIVYTSITVLLCSFIIMCLWNIGILGIWFEGISYAAGSLDKYSSEFIISDKSYSIDINLDDLESNKGKIVVDDGIHKIYVDSVDNTNSINSGGYRIHFRSSGKYTLDGATLLSGIKHYTTENRWYSYTMTAEMTTEYNGHKYKGSVMGLSGLNYKDGDMFSFYVFPGEAYLNDNITLNEKGVAKITLTSLCRNIWSRK